METIDCIKSRASVRSFRPDDIQDTAVDEMIDAAMQAPCAGNIQEWKFVVVRNNANKKGLAKAAFEQKMISDAPVVIVVCADMKEIGNAYGERGENVFSIQDAATAAENLMLAAWDKGIGSCWIGSFNEKAVKDVLVLPSHVRPMTIIPLGYPVTKPKKPGRKHPGDVVHRDFY